MPNLNYIRFTAIAVASLCAISDAFTASTVIQRSVNVDHHTGIGIVDIISPWRLQSQQPRSIDDPLPAEDEDVDATDPARRRKESPTRLLNENDSSRNSSRLQIFIAELDEDRRGLRDRIFGLNKEIHELKEEINGLKEGINELKQKMKIGESFYQHLRPSHGCSRWLHQSYVQCRPDRILITFRSVQGKGSKKFSGQQGCCKASLGSNFEARIRPIWDDGNQGVHFNKK